MSVKLVPDQRGANAPPPIEQGATQMSEAKHTPGPWTVRSQQIMDATSSVIARVTDNEVSGFDCPTPAVAKRNAALLAAAPDLLAALQALANECERIPHVMGSTSLDMKVVVAEARSALSKAGF